MILAVGSSLVQISKNGETTAVDCGNNVIFRNDKTYVPLRFVTENSSVNVGGTTNLSILSLKYKLNGFRIDSGYDFYICNNEAIKLTIKGNLLCIDDEEFPDIKCYSDEELKQMALEEIKLYKNEVVEKQRVLKKYKDGKYVYGVVTEIINTASNIGRAEYFEIEG